MWCLPDKDQMCCYHLRMILQFFVLFFYVEEKLGWIDDLIVLCATPNRKGFSNNSMMLILLWLW